MAAPLSHDGLLVVEDSDEDFAVIGWALQRAGFPGPIRRCTRVAEALSVLGNSEAESLAPGARPRVVLLDLNLPDGDGRDLLEALWTRHGALPVPIVILTSSAHPHDMADCTRLGAAGYLVKPFDRATFAAQIQAFVQAWFTPWQHPQS
ncbi:response regulator [uncultured Thiodictyon sp.]|uniref:response regulator n=1 Tax=uncultured Thiodictyon sp. TaxID=1846217 RepID=UPI0025DD8C69|nr:response regulator [uncultured Thiodictyon sp.]